MPHIITVGEILVEVMAQKVGQTFLSPGLWQAPYPSGAPAIFISQAARFGAKTGMVGCVGDDDFGRLNINRLKEDGVDVSRIALSKSLPTGCAFVTYRKDGGRSFIYHIPNSAAGRITPEQVNDEWLKDCRYLHVMGSSFSIPGVYATIEKCIPIIRKNGGKISFDPNIRKELLAGDKTMRRQIMELYQQTDLLLPGADELSLLTGKDELDQAVDKVFAKTSIEHLAVKMAADGCYYASRDESFSVDAFPVKEVDPTGAGDCFGGALIAALTMDYPIREAITLAAAAGALAVTKKGPMEGACRLDELKAFVASHTATA